MWVIPVFCKNGSIEPKFTFATLGGGGDWSMRVLTIEIND